MQNTSNEWKQNQKQNFVSESFAEITLKVADPEASEDAAATDNGHVYFSDTTNVAKDVVKNNAKLATLEMNIWTLDGSCEILPASSPYGTNGFVGDEVSDDAGYYSDNPTLTISFPGVVTSVIPGITVLWGDSYDECADSFNVTVKKNGVPVLERSIIGNTDRQTLIDDDIAQYDEIEIEVVRWCLPHRRARIKEVVIGIFQTFTKADILSIENSFAVDPLSASLPQAQIRFVLKNLNGKFNAENAQGFVKYIMERQRVTARYGYKIGGVKEWISGGMYYLSEWEMPQNGITATFTARDAIEFMQDAYVGSLYGGLSLYSIADSAFRQANMPELEAGIDRWIIDDSLKNITAYEWALAEGATIAELLQYVANAGCCVLYQDRSGIFHIEPLDTTPADYAIDGFTSYENAETQYIKQLKAVVISNGDAEYAFTYGTAGDTQTVNNPLISAARAQTVANWIHDSLVSRKVMSGNFRPDPRLDALDIVEINTPYTNNNAVITEITYSYNGAFRGKYNARCI